MKKPVFVGSCTALVTPFTNDFDSSITADFDKLDMLIEEQIEAGTSALVVCGTTGEASTQSIPKHLETVARAVKQTDGRIPIIAGTGANSTDEALYMSKEAEKSGADALLIVTPYYNKCSSEGLIKHYTVIADNVGIPIVLYNVPSRTNINITPQIYYELSKHERIVGTKEASGDFTNIAKTRALCGNDFYIWSGNDEHTIPIMALGGKGVISVASNVIPAQMSEICKLFIDGKTNESVELFLRYMPLLDALFMDVNPIPVKTALNMMGKDVGKLRMPLCDMDETKNAKLKSILSQFGLVN